MPPIDLDEVIEELGSYGRFQVELFVYLVIPVMVKTIYNAQYIFAAGKTEYRCRVPQCESTPEQLEPGPWAKFALPGHLQRDCYRYVAIGDTCEPSSFTNKLERCYSWVYENHYTIVYEYELACQEWKRTLVGTIHVFGYFTALPAIAYFSDMYGRGRVLVFTSIVPAFIGLGRAFVDNYYLYLVLEYFESLTGSGTYSAAFILGVEMVTVNNRVAAGNLIAALSATGQSFLGGIAYLFPYWRTLTIILYAPSFVFFSYICLYKESVRWLITKGHNKEAAKILLRAAKLNKKKLSLKTMASLVEDSKVEVNPNEEEDNSKKLPEVNKKKTSTWMKVLKSKTMMFRLVICSYAWITMSLVYYGLSINSVSLAGNRYVNFAVSSLVEVPGNIISALALDRYGRKSSICCAQFLCGISLIMTTLETQGILNTALTMFGKLWISMISCSTYIYTIELFPTEARHSLLSACSMMGRIGAMLAPQTPLLLKSNQNLPNVIFGVMSALAGMLLLLTPETLRMKLPDTVEEAENLKIMPRTLEKTDTLKGNTADNK